MALWVGFHQEEQWEPSDRTVATAVVQFFWKEKYFCKKVTTSDILKHEVVIFSPISADLSMRNDPYEFGERMRIA